MIQIVDYRAGNLRSVQRACRFVGVDAELQPDPDKIARAERIIFPGVGTAESGMSTLRSSGLGEALHEAFGKGTPILGICLGAQIILDYSEEGEQPCLGIIPGKCVRFRPADPALKVPHIGWNAVVKTQGHPVLQDFADGIDYYYVNSYYPVPTHQEHVFGVTEYGVSFCAMLGKENLFATQFHLEKSGRYGLALLQRFTCWDGDVTTP
jgi:glutamine amidotransferase